MSWAASHLLAINVKSFFSFVRFPNHICARRSRWIRPVTNLSELSAAGERASFQLQATIHVFEKWKPLLWVLLPTSKIDP